MHISIILATVPCIRPWLIAFESHGLQAPADVRNASKQQTCSPKLAPLLPIALPPPMLNDDIALMPGNASHRQRVEAWPVQMWQDQKTTVTTVEHDPLGVKEFQRKRSLDSESSKGIKRTTSYSVKSEDMGHFLKTTSPELSTNKHLTRAMSYQVDFADAGEPLAELPRAKQKQRVGSVGSV